MIDTERLKPPLKVFPDDPAKGGDPAHVSIAPVNEIGRVDQDKLKEWASCRGTGRRHSFTQMLKDAVIQVDVRG
jgi:hypothetical protein